MSNFETEAATHIVYLAKCRTDDERIKYLSAIMRLSMRETEMKTINGFVIGAVILSIASFGFMCGRLSDPDVPPMPQRVAVITSAAEVSDLLDQLRTVSRGDSEYDTYIKFSLKTVRIKVRSKNGDDHEVGAPTLRAAVKQLTAPDGTISNALKQWEAVYPGREGL